MTTEASDPWELLCTSHQGSWVDGAAEENKMLKYQTI